jgi:hypothetical protein
MTHAKPCSEHDPNRITTTIELGAETVRSVTGQASAATPVGDPSEHPELLYDLTVTELYSLPESKVAEFRVAALRNRFKSLAQSVATLGRLADEQKIDEIESLEAAAPLLFLHSMYKSYPTSVLEKGDFKRLTRWLGGLTSYDISRIDVESCDTIDDWIDALDAQSELRVIHSAGTTGKLSFLPRSEREVPRMAKGFRRYYEGFGNEPNAPLVGLEKCPVIIPNYRKGAMGQARLLDGLVTNLYGGNEDMIVTLNSGRLSADMLSLAGRIRVAESKGQLGRLQISKTLLARREAFLQEQTEQPARRAAFFERVANSHRGKRVVIMGHWHQHYEVATDALARGIEHVFAPDSLMFVAGGMKGRMLPDGYQDVVKRYLGVSRIGAGYGMSEVVSMTPACSRGKFHIQPYVIPYVLDPKTGTPLPRTGTHTGRYGFIDLMAETYWGGFLTGDEVTIDWGDSNPCRCGRNGAFLHESIRRYSETEGGDDKVTCAGAPEAHDRALSFLNALG